MSYLLKDVDSSTFDLKIEGLIVVIDLLAYLNGTRGTDDKADFCIYTIYDC